MRQEEDGYLYFEGRTDDVIISAGYRIGPFEVESALVSHPAVAEAAVVAAPDEERGSVVRAVVVLRDGFAPSDSAHDRAPGARPRADGAVQVPADRRLRARAAEDLERQGAPGAAAGLDSLDQMDRPVIGICTSLVQAAWSVWEQRAALTPYGYIAAIQRAGGLAVMIPPDPEFEREPDQVLDLIDGLILAGGNDIDPAPTAPSPIPRPTETVPERDQSELALVRRAWERDMPVLGICRGMQLLNVVAGRHAAPAPPRRGRPRRPPDQSRQLRRRRPRRAARSGSLAARAAGEEVHVTKSHHHQGVDVVGEGLRVTGHSALGDDLPEAVEAPERRFVLGVQWHPEADETSTRDRRARASRRATTAARAARRSRPRGPPA